MQVASICFYLLTAWMSTVAVVISIYILFLMIIHQRFFRRDRVELLLLSNTFISIVLCEPFIIILCIFSMYGHTHDNFVFEGWPCLIIAFFMYVGAFIYFNSFALQAVYRCFNIVLPGNARLQLFVFYQIWTVIIWLISICAMLILLLCDQLEYIPYDYHCQFSPNNFKASLLLYCSGFILPFSVTLFAYTCAIYHVRKQTAVFIVINQDKRKKRDMLILKRLVILLSIINISAAPHIGLPIAHLITIYSPLWIISFTWFFTLIGVLSTILILLFTHPILKKLCLRPLRVSSNVVPVITNNTI